MRVKDPSARFADRLEEPGAAERLAPNPEIVGPAEGSVVQVVEVG
jgi:hypothetical protein